MATTNINGTMLSIRYYNSNVNHFVIKGKIKCWFRIPSLNIHYISFATGSVSTGHCGHWKKRLLGARYFVWLNMLITSCKLFFMCMIDIYEIPKIKSNNMLIKYVQQQWKQQHAESHYLLYLQGANWYKNVKM